MQAGIALILSSLAYLVLVLLLCAVLPLLKTSCKSLRKHRVVQHARQQCPTEKLTLQAVLVCACVQSV